MYKQLRIFSTLIFVGFLLAACGSSGGGGGNPSTLSPASGKITGQVFDGTTGQVISGATVRAAGKSATTTADGSYELSGLNNGDRIIVTVSVTGFSDQSKIARISDQAPNANLAMRLLPIGLTQTFDPDTAQTLSDTNSPASVTLSAGSLRKADGSSPEGNVTIKLTVIDPTIDIDLMPGDMQTDVGGVLSPIESFGAIIATFTDEIDNDLNLASGSIATIRIPLADKSGNPPTTIPLFFYDETQGLWVEEGTATLLSDASGTYYEGTVGHFSTWNADSLYAQIRINGCVQDANGTRIAGISILTIGDDYSGTASTFTDASGNFSVIAKPMASVLVSGSQAGLKTNTVKLQTGASDLVMNDCLVLPAGGGNNGDTSVSIKLSWGENPLDLDAYLVGPNNIFVYFGSQGSLSSFPFSQLDVDDLSSFGPEVITIFQFPDPGNYRYSVNNFSRTFSPGMTESPARVELTLNGNITLFTPPVGENENLTWDVLEFVVSADGSVSVNPINTWSASAPGVDT